MKKVIRDLYFEVFSYPTEDDAKVFESIYNIVGSKIDLAAERVESYYGPSILKYHFRTEKQPLIKKVMKHILEKIPEKEKKDILKDMKNRVDEQGNLYIRFDKQEAYQKKLIISYHGDVVKMRIGFTSYPFLIKTVYANVRDVFENSKL